MVFVYDAPSNPLIGGIVVALGKLVSCNYKFPAHAWVLIPSGSVRVVLSGQCMWFGLEGL